MGLHREEIIKLKSNNPLSVYIENKFPVESLGLIHSFFSESNEIGESGWAKFASKDKSGYKRGKQVALSLDYDSNSLEVKAWIEEGSSEIIVSVGNSGFPFEPMLAKKRFQKIADQLSDYVQGKSV